MIRVLIRRVLWIFPILIGVSLATFILLRALPGDYAQMVAGVSDGVTPEVLDAIRSRLGLDRPIWEQYLDWVSGVLVGDFGSSLNSGLPVTEEVFSRLGITLQMTLMALVFAMILGGLTGLVSGVFGGFFERTVRVINTLGIAVPNFVFGTLVVLFVGLYFPWVSVIGYTPIMVDPIGSIRSLFFPALVLSLSMSVVVSENLSASMRDVENQDYVTVAKAKGLSSRRILGSYVLKNSLTPVVTVLGIQFSAVVGGSIIVETIFAVPGLGQSLFDAVVSRDYPLLQGIVITVAAMVILVNLIVDLIYIKLDSRVRYGVS